MSVDRLENIMGDYQFREQRSGKPDIDPSEVYLRVFRGLGWSEEKAKTAVDDVETSLEERLLETVGSAGHAASLLRDAIEAEIAAMAAAEAGPTRPGP